MAVVMLCIMLNMCYGLVVSTPRIKAHKDAITSKPSYSNENC